MKRITTYLNQRFSPRRQKRIAIGLILFSLVPLFLGIWTFTSSLAPSYKTIIGSGLFLLGDVIYYLGIALLGKTIYEKYKRFLRRSYWVSKYQRVFLS
ncbi:hypothetical protein BKI52_29040 [marine bacterium AO1-C]|nr:hypothetical protein BKI52_29040 [marine bacterium AO1-C]